MNKATAYRRAFRGRVYPADRERDPYLLLPFDVPPGIRHIELAYDYDGDGNVLDLGVFDSRGYGFLTPEGFRGWSGSARKRVVIGEVWATPGYIPGPIYPGIWHVILGLYKVRPRGCAYEVEVRLHRDPVEIQEREVLAVHGPDYPTMAGVERPGWLKGDLHCHTHHSEAQGSVRDLVWAAERKGLDFLAITDHNTVSHWREMEELVGGSKIILIPGEEVTTYRGHANVWGQGRWLDFRCRTPGDIEAVYRAASSEDRIFSINHPKPGGPPWEFGFDVPFDCLEVWHGLWGMGNEASLELWDAQLRHGKRVVAVGGSDTHPRFRNDGTLVEWLGYPTTWVFSQDRSSSSVLNGIRKGHVSISACPSGPFVSLELRCEGEVFRQGMRVPPVEKGRLGVEVCGGQGLELAVVTDQGIFTRERVPDGRWRAELTVDTRTVRFVRAELRVPIPGPRLGPLAAITNPIWCGNFLPGKISHSRRRK